ncbi:MAG: fibronectin type III domain-containing protein [bacterium]
MVVVPTPPIIAKPTVIPVPPVVPKPAVTPVPPAAPTNLQLEPVSKAAIKLSWSDNSNDEAGFKIERALLSKEYVEIKILPPNTTSFTDERLTKDTFYSYRIRAYNKVGNSEYSNPAGIRTLDIVPSAPTKLTGASNISTAISLSWQDNSNNEAGFKIERRVETEPGYTTIAILEQNTTSYQDSGLTPNLTYYYRVRAYNRSGHSEYSNLLSVKTLPVRPFVPTNLKISSISSNQINLSWQDNSDNETGFELERKVEEGNYEKITNIPANTTSYEDKKLEPNTTYYYRIMSYNQAGKSSYSNEQKATTKDIPPYSPSGLLAKPISTTQIDLCWEDNSKNEQGFKLERCRKEQSWTQIAILPADTTAYQDKDLQQNTSYFYRLRAYNGLGDSDYSNEVECLTLDILPISPTNLHLLTISPDKVKLMWQDNSDNESGFKIERRQKDGVYAQIDTVSKNTTEYQDKGLLPDIDYSYRLRAYNQTGNSEYSNEAMVKIIQTIPSSPLHFEAKAISESKIQLTWEDNSDNESGFKIERKASDKKEFVQIAIVPANMTSYTDSNLKPDTIYYYYLRAFNQAGDSDYSNIARAQTHPTPSQPTSKIQSSRISPYIGVESPDISWTYAIKSKIYRSNPIIDTQGRIYVGAEDSYLYCFSPQGKLIWKYLVNGKINTSVAIGEDGVIYVVSPDKNLYALTPNGSLKWKYPVKFPVESSPVIAPNLAIFTFTSNGKIYSIHPDGRIRWTSEVSEVTTTQTPIIDDNGNIFIGAEGINGGLFCLDSKGNIKWQYNKAGSAFTSPTLDSNGNIYIGLINGLYSFTPQGTVRWKIEKIATKFSPVISVDNVLYCYDSQKGNLIALKESGQILWEYPLAATDISPIIDSAGNIYPISQDNLSCLLSNGRLKWNYTLDSKISTSPAIGQDGTIYVGGDREFYAIGAGDKKPSIAPGSLTTKVLSSSQIDLGWIDNSKDESGFIVERATTDGIYTQLATLPPNTINYQDTNLPPMTTYYYRIKAFNQYGDSDYCSYVYATTYELPPSLPTAVSILPLKTGSKLQLTWQNPPEKTFSHLQIYRSIVKDNPGNLIADDIKKNTYLDTGLVNNLPYYYRFVVCDIYGNKSIPSIPYIGIADDIVLPEIIDYTPVGENISPETVIILTFNEKMDNESVIGAFSISPPTTGTFTWEANKLIFRPVSDLYGNTKYTISVSKQACDISGNNLQKPVKWQFTTFNPAPIIWSYSPVDLSPTIFEGEAITFEVYASDSNDNVLRYSWKLDGVEKSKTNSWTYTPSATEAGVKRLILSITDGTSMTLQNWTITVLDRNIPPKLSLPKQEIIINTNELLQFNISAEDEDGDLLRYTTSSLPEGAYFSEMTKIFSWRPTNAQNGIYRIIFKVNDGKGGEDEKEIKIYVNRPPIIE